MADTQHLTFMEEMDSRTRKIIEEVLAAREGEKAEKTTVHGRGTMEGITSFSSPVHSPASSSTPLNVLSRWPWVEKETVEFIANGQFNIDGLPKLHETDELRNAYIKKSLKGIYQPLEGGPSEIIIGTTKLQSAFKDSTTFFLAWHI